MNSVGSIFGFWLAPAGGRVGRSWVRKIVSPSLGLCLASVLFGAFGCSVPEKAVGKADRRSYRILPVGDSITVGYTDNPTWAVPFEFGYRGELFQLLSQEGIAFQFVGHSAEPWNGLWKVPTNAPALDLRGQGQDAHEAYGARASGFVAQHIAGWVRTNQPDLILLMIGINDIPAGATNLSATVKANLRQIAQAVMQTRPAAHLIVAETIPYTRPTPALNQLNEFIRGSLIPEFARRGARISSVDQYANFVSAGQSAGNRALYSNGYNHPNAEGYRRMAATWFEGIKRAIQKNNEGRKIRT